MRLGVSRGNAVTETHVAHVAEKDTAGKKIHFPVAGFHVQTLIVDEEIRFSGWMRRVAVIVRITELRALGLFDRTEPAPSRISRISGVLDEICVTSRKNRRIARRVRPLSKPTRILPVRRNPLVFVFLQQNLILPFARVIRRISEVRCNFSALELVAIQLVFAAKHVGLAIVRDVLGDVIDEINRLELGG